MNIANAAYGAAAMKKNRANIFGVDITDDDLPENLQSGEIYKCVNKKCNMKGIVQRKSMAPSAVKQAMGRHVSCQCGEVLVYLGNEKVLQRTNPLVLKNTPEVEGVDFDKLHRKAAEQASDINERLQASAVADQMMDDGNKASVRAAEETLNLNAPLAGQFHNAKHALEFITAGDAIFTVRSAATSTRYTFKVTRANCSRCSQQFCNCWQFPTFFVALLTGPENTSDYTYLGMIRENRFQLTRKSKMRDDSAPFKAFRWVWEHINLNVGQLPPKCELWHEGRCGRCGRPLTVPESIERGLGPDCAGRMGM